MSDRAGDVITEDDPDYNRRRATFNGLVDRRPARIHLCASLDDVVRAVRTAREMGLPISIRGGGHGVAGLCVGDGALVVDLSAMRQVDIDPSAARAVAQGGATWADYDEATLKCGLASNGGTFTDTGIAGLTLGGGIGFLQGTQGFTVDTLTGGTVVTADGEVLRASAEQHPELFWALRGAGANFGVTVDFEYALRPIPPLYGGSITFPLSAAADVLRVTRDLAGRAPDELALQYVAGRRDGVTAVLACFQGTAADGKAVLEPLRHAARIESDALRPLTYSEMQATNLLLPFGLRHYWKGHFIAALTDEHIELAAEHIARRPGGGFASLLIEFIGGAPLRVPAEAMAFNQRSARANASALAIWADPAFDREHIAWARSFAAGLTGPGTSAEYINYMAVDTATEAVQRAFGREKYTRLRELKTRYDPDNVFRFNHNIPPLPR